MAYENLFNYMAKEHGLNLLQEEMQEIERMVELDKDGSNCNLPQVSKRVSPWREDLICDNCGMPESKHTLDSKMCPKVFKHFKQINC